MSWSCYYCLDIFGCPLFYTDLSYFCLEMTKVDAWYLINFSKKPKNLWYPQNNLTFGLIFLKLYLLLQPKEHMRLWNQYMVLAHWAKG